jgi:lysophospholipase L1-like esterase
VALGVFVVLLGACGASPTAGDPSTGSGGGLAPATGGSASGGTTASGGFTATGGADASGGVTGSGGATASGGVVATGGADAGASGGTSAGGSDAALGGQGGTTSSGGAAAVGGHAAGGAGGRGGAPGRGGAGGGPATSTGGTGGPITLWLAGDSTVANGTTPCPVGWGKEWKARFDARVTVTNSAVGGTSLHTWLYNVLDTKDANGECELTRDGSGNPVLQSRWQNMLTSMKTGDYLFIQFGINDGGDCPRYEGSAQFKTTLGMMAMAAKSRGTNPVFVTPVSSIKCNGSTATGTRGRFVTDTIAAGTQFGVPVIDLHARSVALYTASGFCPLPAGMTDVSATTGGPVGAFFCDDHTHFEASGAIAIGNLVVDAIRAQLPALSAYLK